MYFSPSLLATHKIPPGSQAPVNAYFEALLETGVDEMAWDDVGDDNVSRGAGYSRSRPGLLHSRA